MKKSLAIFISGCLITPSLIQPTSAAYSFSKPAALGPSSSLFREQAIVQALTLFFRSSFGKKGRLNAIHQHPVGRQPETAISRSPQSEQASPYLLKIPTETNWPVYMVSGSLMKYVRQVIPGHDLVYIAPLESPRAFTWTPWRFDLETLLVQAALHQEPGAKELLDLVEAGNVSLFDAKTVVELLQKFPLQGDLSHTPFVDKALKFCLWEVHLTFIVDRWARIDPHAGSLLEQDLEAIKISRLRNDLRGLPRDVDLLINDPIAWMAEHGEDAHLAEYLNRLLPRSNKAILAMIRQTKPAVTDVWHTEVIAGKIATGSSRLSRSTSITVFFAGFAYALHFLYGSSIPSMESTMGVTGINPWNLATGASLALLSALFSHASGAGRGKSLLERLGFKQNFDHHWIEAHLPELPKGLAKPKVSGSFRLVTDLRTKSLHAIFKEDVDGERHGRLRSVPHAKQPLWIYQLFVISKTGEIRILSMPRDHETPPTNADISHKIEREGYRLDEERTAYWGKNGIMPILWWKSLEGYMRDLYPGDRLIIEPLGSSDYLNQASVKIRRNLTQNGFERLDPSSDTHHYIRIRRTAVKLFSWGLLLAGLASTLSAIHATKGWYPTAQPSRWMASAA